MSKHTPKTENIYNSLCIQQLEQQYCSSCSAAVVSSCCVVSSRGLGERLVSRIYNGGRKAVYAATVGAMLANNLTPYAGAATITVSSGVVSTGLTTSSGDRIDVYGTTSNTQVGTRASENIYSGGVANNTLLSGYRAYQQVSSGAKANGTIISSGGSQYIYQAGVANNTTIASGGLQTVNSGAIASGVDILEHGMLTVYRNGSALDVNQHTYGKIDATVAGEDSTLISGTNADGGDFLLSGGYASGFVVNSGVTGPMYPAATKPEAYLR